MDEHVVDESSISRRTVIKRVGVGAAVAWSAPVLSSLAAPAFAGTPELCAGDSCNGPEFPCGGSPRCFCTGTAEGRFICGCFDRGGCDGYLACDSSSDCPSGEFCTTLNTPDCCGGICVALCSDSCGAGAGAAGGGPPFA